MEWKADKTTTLAAIACTMAGMARIALAHDWTLECALIALGIIIAIRTFIYYWRHQGKPTSN